MNYNFLKKIESRVIYIIIISILILTILASYLYLFKKPLHKYKQLKRNRVTMEMRIPGKNGLPAIIAALEGDIADLHGKIFGSNQVVPADEMIAETLFKLDGISAKEKVILISVKPEKSIPAELFIETPFSVEVKGEYINLYQWIFQVEHQLAPMIVKQFTLSGNSAEAKDLTMKLKLASYQPVGEQI